MTIDFSTPALLFPAITLLLLAYSNRYLALATRIRDLHKQHLEHPEKILLQQIKNMRTRVYLIRNMQAFGILSFFGCVLCMTFLYLGSATTANYLFGASLVVLLISLALSLIETQMSTYALSLQLRDMEDAPTQTTDHE